MPLERECSRSKTQYPRLGVTLTAESLRPFLFAECGIYHRRRRRDDVSLLAYRPGMIDPVITLELNTLEFLERGDAQGIEMSDW